MSRKRKDPCEEDILDQLVRENNSLKKKIGKLRKMASKALEPEEDLGEDEPIPPRKKKKIDAVCTVCGGQLKRIEIMGVVLDVCQECKHRVKVKIDA